jgi:hypothetical protein
MRYVECTWFFHDAVVILSGRVEGDTVRGFAAETSDGEPFRIPDAAMPDALHDLIEAGEGA